MAGAGPADRREPLRAWLAGGRLPAAPTIEDAADLTEAARLQGLLGLLHAAVEEAHLHAGPAWPETARERLSEAHRTLLVRGVAQLDLARRAQEIAEGAGARCLPLKGAAMVEAYYPSPGDRPMSDVDLLVLDGSAAVRRALSDRGFQPLEEADHAWALLDPVTGGTLELHHSVCSCPGFYPLDGPGLWERSRPAAGQVKRLPSAEDLLLHLSLHAAFQHGLVLSLVQYLDFRRLLERTAIDVDRLLRIAADSRAEAPLALALGAAEAVVAAPVPSSLRDRLRERLAAPLAARLEAITADPLAVVAPVPAGLFHVRWDLARGRRMDWLGRTLAPVPPGGRRGSLWPVRAAVRGLSLALRWGPQAWADRRRAGS